MITNTNSISKLQLYIFIIQSQIGIGLLSLPNAVQSTAKGDGWISTLIAGVVVQITLFIYWLLLRKYPNATYTDITKKILGKYVGKFCNIFIYIYFIMIGSLACVLFIRSITLWLLPLTPMWVLSLIIILSSIYLTISDLRIISRFFVLASVLIILLFLLSFFTFYLPNELRFILPIGHSGVKNILLGSHKSLLSILGFESLLLIFPFVLDTEKGILNTVSLANFSVTLFYTYFTFICLVSFSPTQLLQIREPVLYLFKALSFEMIDRLDLIFISVWIVPMTTSVILYLFLSAKSISNEKTFKKNVCISGILIFFITIIPFDEDQLAIFDKYVTYLSYVVVFGLPFILLCLSFIISKTERSEQL
ncbi:GerAB/ArcD/ProY family transporter [Gottfriedia acidiceleris]|uniref:GerAB/ArcD/ProY family transporter n=1 Tax=Gottfriedia acidiceleris TaxID=371036 RepID=UPI0033984BEF